MANLGSMEKATWAWTGRAGDERGTGGRGAPGGWGTAGARASRRGRAYAALELQCAALGVCDATSKYRLYVTQCRRSRGSPPRRDHGLPRRGTCGPRSADPTPFVRGGSAVVRNFGRLSLEALLGSPGIAPGALHLLCATSPPRLQTSDEWRRSR